METKICSKCKIEKSLEFFNKDKNKKDGFYPSCKDCGKKYAQSKEYKELRRKNRQRPEVKEKEKLYSREYNQRPEIKERHRQNEKDPKRKQYKIEYNLRPEVIKRKEEYYSRPDVMERILKRRKKYNDEYYQRPEVKERRKQYKIEYCKRPEVKARRNKNRQKPEVRAKRKVHDHLRRARKLNVPGKWTIEDEKQMFITQEGKCYYCKEIFKLDIDPKCPKGYHVEHKIPLSRPELNPTNGPENICLACPGCNHRKWNKTEEEFLRVLDENKVKKLQ